MKVSFNCGCEFELERRLNDHPMYGWNEKLDGLYPIDETLTKAYCKKICGDHTSLLNKEMIETMKAENEKRLNKAIKLTKQ